MASGNHLPTARIPATDPTPSRSHPMPTPFVNNLDAPAREAMIDVLNDRLADALALSLAVKQAHWNVKGTSFIGFHEFLDEVAGRMNEHADSLAERAVILGGYAKGTVEVTARESDVEAYPVELSDIQQHAKELSDRFITFGGSIRDAIDIAEQSEDADTADLFTEISRIVDKDAWFLGAHVPEMVDTAVAAE